MLRITLALLALLALLVLPGQASAAEGFVGVTERGSLVRFTTQAPYIRRSANRRWALVRTRAGLVGWIPSRSLCRG